MSIDWIVIIIILILLTGANIAVLTATVMTKKNSVSRFRSRERLRSMVNRSVIRNSLGSTVTLAEQDRIPFFLEWHEVSSHLEISSILREELETLAIQWDLPVKIDNLLKSRFFKKRVNGMNVLPFLPDKEKLEALREASQREKSVILRLRIIQMLCREGSLDAVGYIIESFQGKPEFYKKKVLGILEENVTLMVDWADSNRDQEGIDALRILIRAAGTNLREWHYDFLVEQSKNPDRLIAREAAGVLMNRFSDRTTLDFLMTSEEESQRQNAVFRFTRDMELPSDKEMLELFRTKGLYSYAVSGLIEKIHRDPRLISELFRRYQMAEALIEKQGYAAVLASRVQYFIRRLKSDESAEVRDLLSDMVGQGMGAPIINFLNANKSPTLENLLLETIQPLTLEYPEFLELCQYYLGNRLKRKLDLPQRVEEEGTPKIQLTRKDRFIMLGMALSTLLLPLGIYAAVYGSIFPYMIVRERVVTFLLLYHYEFAFYSIAINSVSLILMILSWTVIREQRISWQAVDKEFLFSRGILPSVTILAPAYNEEKSIVQNVYSLLSLEYPDLELIVINDGSIDRTFQNLVDNFDLELVDYPIPDFIPTAPILGLYRNEHIPNLLVIDKKNGGKADSLNTGLNAARGEYVCSIDADSLLEPEALSKMMFQTINSEKLTIAVGGNIIPVNGCIVEHGGIREIHLSRNKYSRYQTIEYLRSFIAGRLGWSKLNSLMIISGAFGAFLKQDLLDIGGYMTGTGSMKKDTVGEDMELVVRLIRHHYEKGEPFSVGYSHNANCWTEVPENLPDLLKQRGRWHRGLIEILLYHRTMLLNRKFKVVGLLAFPYFFLFELLGPFWEFLGYLVLLASLFLGLLNGTIFLFMFSIIVLLGNLVSSTALLLAESDVLYFKGKEFRQSILTALRENFGYRQMISMHRVFSYVMFLFRDRGWQKLSRKGFSHE